MKIPGFNNPEMKFANHPLVWICEQTELIVVQNHTKLEVRSIVARTNFEFRAVLENN
jgi:hypothetical protein